MKSQVQKRKQKTRVMNKKVGNNLTSFADHLDSQYGIRGTASRELYEQEFEAFKLGAMLQELRKEKGLTQEQLAEKCGTTKTYISRIENNASDIRLSTLMRIIQEGLGGQLKLSVDF
jgi:HTH-type transcriptional regulator / antitoxin HipB